MNQRSHWLSRLVKQPSRKKAAYLDPPAPPDISARTDKLTQEITVMSYNLLCATGGEHALSRRFDGVLQTIRSAAPDSFGVQEAHELWRYPLKRALKDEYGIACNFGRICGANEGTPIFYRKDRYTLRKQGVFWLSDHPRIASFGWDASLPRIAGYAVLRDKRTGFTYVHFNTHFDHRGFVAMANSARLIADRINAMGLPAVLTGDLNDEPGSRPIEYLLAAGLRDLRTAAAVTEETETFHGYDKNENKIIDYIFANYFLREAAQYNVIRDMYSGQYPSDHFAVTARLTMAN